MVYEPGAPYACVSVTSVSTPAPNEYVSAGVWSPQSRVDAWLSSLPGSVKPPEKVTGWPATSTIVSCVTLLMTVVGATFRPVIVADALPVTLPSSVACSVAANVPSSSGAKETVAPLPLAKALPFLVTVHEYVNPAELSAALALAADPVSDTSVP